MKLFGVIRSQPKWQLCLYYISYTLSVYMLSVLRHVMWQVRRMANKRKSSHRRYMERHEATFVIDPLSTKDRYKTLRQANDRTLFCRIDLTQSCRSYITVKMFPHQCCSLMQHNMIGYVQIHICFKMSHMHLMSHIKMSQMHIIGLKYW